MVSVQVFFFWLCSIKCLCVLLSSALYRGKIWASGTPRPISIPQPLRIFYATIIQFFSSFIIDGIYFDNTSASITLIIYGVLQLFMLLVDSTSSSSIYNKIFNNILWTLSNYFFCLYTSFFFCKASYFCAVFYMNLSLFAHFAIRLPQQNKCRNA